MIDITSGGDAFAALSSGINKLSDVVGSTLGPCGRTVLMESKAHLHGMTATKDGATVASGITLPDPVEDLAVRVVRQASMQTASNAGDGTTTSVVLSEALVRHGSRLMGSPMETTDVLRDMERAIDERILPYILEGSRKVTVDNISDIATISANNDAGIGEMIGKAYGHVGENGSVTIEKSDGSQTYVEVTDGIRIERGYASPGFINNRKHDECIYDGGVHVLVCDTEISSFMSIEKVMAHVFKNPSGKLLIIAPCTQNLINVLAANVIQNGIKCVVIPPPDFGWRQHELMQDIALSVGATYFSEQTGDDLSHITTDDLGMVEKVVAGRAETIIVRRGEVSEAALKRIDEIADSGDAFIQKRLSVLSGKVARIYVGGDTDMEQKERYDRVEDAVLAVRSALEEGIVPGGGTMLIRAAVDTLSKDVTADSILYDALWEPFSRILGNAGEDAGSVACEVLAKDAPHGYNVKDRTYGDMFEMGVMDPVKVVRESIQNALSVATTILNASNVVTFQKD